jgi:hypothetical protein
VTEHEQGLVVARPPAEPRPAHVWQRHPMLVPQAPNVVTGAAAERSRLRQAQAEGQQRMPDHKGSHAVSASSHTAHKYICC